MRLSNGFVIDKEKTFGELKFTAVRDVFLQNEVVWQLGQAVALARVQ